MFYYFLTANFFRLNDLKFSSLKVHFSNNKSIEISKNKIEKTIERIYTYPHPEVAMFVNKFGAAQFGMLLNKFLTDRESCYEYIDRHDYSAKYPIRVLRHAFDALSTKNIFLHAPVGRKI